MFILLTGRIAVCQLLKPTSPACAVRRSSRMGDDGRMHTERFAESSVSDGRVRWDGQPPWPDAVCVHLRDFGSCCPD